MKFLNYSFVILLLVCEVFEKSHGTNLNCEFKVIGYITNDYYSCVVKSLDNRNNSMVITGYSGIHKEDKNDTDVKGIYIKNTNTKYIPTGLGLLFNLSAFCMESTQLVEIQPQDFIGMENLKELDLGKNQLEEIQNGVFANNLNLEQIYLGVNRIKFLGSFVFDELTKLNRVYLQYNICIDEVYYDNTSIIELKKDIKKKCKNPDELPTIATQIPTTTTQNPLKVQQNELIERLEQEILGLKKNLMEEKANYEKDGVEWEEKNRELIERVTISDAQKLTDKKFEDMKHMFTNLERICNETLLKCEDKQQEKVDTLDRKVLELNQEIIEINQRNCKEVSALNTTLATTFVQLENAVKERDHCYTEKENIIKVVLRLNTRDSECKRIIYPTDATTTTTEY